MFCCEGFKNLINNAGQRGVSALVIYNAPGRFRFELQSRAVTREDELLLSQTQMPGSLLLHNHPPQIEHVALTANIRVNYCPCCGTKLQKLVTFSTKRSFEALADEHKKIYTPPF
jgi:hypothetical protein